MNNFWTQLNKPFSALAPMEDVTDFVFREIVCDIAKPDVLFTEFTNINALSSKGKESALRRLEFSSKQHPIVAQIWGTLPEKFYEASKDIASMGFDGIDINMGCPDYKVVKKCAGAGLIKKPELAKEIIEAARNGAPNLPLSVKTRLGFDSVITEQWITFLLKNSLQALTVHGRIATEKSLYSADWNEIRKAVDIKNSISPNTIIIGNGDVKSYQDIQDKHKAYGVDGVMIGRGIFSNPWIFDKSGEKHKTIENIKLLVKHTKLYSEKWGKTKNFEVMKKFFKVYINTFAGADALRQELMLCRNYDQVVDVVKKSKWGSEKINF